MGLISMSNYICEMNGTKKSELKNTYFRTDQSSTLLHLHREVDMTEEII
jgi:hypothetical protein